MSSIVDDEHYNRSHRQRMLTELAQLGVDEEVLRDEILKLKASRARVHPSPAPRSKSAHQVGREIEVKRKQSHASRAERSHYSREDRSNSRARPSDASPVRSRRNGSSNRSLAASPSRSSSRARNEQVSKSPGRDPILSSTISYADGHICPNCAAQRGSSNAIELHSSHHSDSTEHKSIRSKSNRNSSSERHICPDCASKQGGRNASGFSSPSRHSDRTEHTRNMQLSKQHGVQSKRSISRTNSERFSCPGCAADHGYSNSGGLQTRTRSKSNQRTRLERHICPDCVANHGGSYAVKSNSFGTAHLQNKDVLESRDPQSTGHRKLRMSRLLCLGSTTKDDDLDEMEPYFPHDSRRNVGYMPTYNPHGIQSRSHAIHQDGVTRWAPQNSRSIRAPSNALYSQNAAGYLRENDGIRRRSEFRAESLSTMSKSMPRSTAHRRNSTNARDRLNPVYPSGRYQNTLMTRDRLNSARPRGRFYRSRRDADRDESSEDALDFPRNMENVVNSLRSTARDYISPDIDDVWLSSAVLNGIAQSKNLSVDNLIESACDKLDVLEDSFFGPEDETNDNQSKSCFPKLQMKVSW